MNLQKANISVNHQVKIILKMDLLLRKALNISLNASEIDDKFEPYEEEL